ncbi:MAG: glycoside hydrolase family 3 C-terminal domain-containing protein [Bacillales bacterium]|nr:glycoside hydrolase family 3 C-terminal domain-containing protein [Bacillales bacterium]
MKNKKLIPWIITTTAVLSIGVVVNVLATQSFYDIICTVLSDRGTMEIVGTEKSRFEIPENIKTKKDAKEYGKKVTREICEEGFTLLKNKDKALPLKEGAKVSVFGKNSVNIAYGGSGSGAADTSEIKDIFTSLEESGFQYSKGLKEFYEDPNRSGKGRDANNSDLDNGNTVAISESFVGETPIDKYSDDVWNTTDGYKDAALIVITRIGGEGADLPRSADDHILKLRPAEKDLINAVKGKGFEKVVLLLNTASAMELKDVQEDAGVDSILWIGFDGTEGMSALGEILKGKRLDGSLISPSGKTVDIYPADFTKDPTWNNFGGALGTVGKISGDAYYEKVGRGTVDTQVYFADYEEGIYYGYRYYETAAAENHINYDEAVVYPFGYGESYTTFSWELVNKASIPTTLEKNTEMQYRVKVKNTGTYPGRDVVELYVTPHYNDGGIEKSAKVLVGFAKTKELQPGEEDTVIITVDSPYTYASYDYKGISGKKGYVVEAGDDYKFTLSTDSHHAKDMNDAVITASVKEDIRYEKDPVTNCDVKNLFSDNEDKSLNSDSQLGSILSRSNIEGTWPKTRTNEEKMVGSEIKEGWNITNEWISSIKSEEANPNNPNDLSTMPTVNNNKDIMITDLVGKDYNDPLWKDFIEQLTVKEMNDLVNKGAFQTIEISRYNVPPTDNTDGPVGWVNFMDKATFNGTCSYCNEVVAASTWNIQRLFDMGVAVGIEGLIGSTETERNRPYTGWYAPGLNLHRSPFGGRNFEYYSEDPFLSGQMSAAISKGTASKGVYTSLKHFAVNETETHRSINGLVTWLDEQTLREVYLKGFEIAIKGGTSDFTNENNKAYFGDYAETKPVSVMSSFNRIGERWTGGDYRLLTTILRDEWGFEGFVICDFNTCSHMVNKDMVYAGGDLNLESAGFRVWKADASSAADVNVLQQCSKNILYVVANSNAIRGEFITHMPKWEVGLFVGDGVICLALAAWGVFVFLPKKKKVTE